MTRPIVVITEPLAPEPLEWLRARSDVRLLNSTNPTEPDLREAHALVVRTYTRVDGSLLDRAPNLRVVARAGVGLDNIDLDACRSRNIAIVHTPAANTEAVVEYVTSMMLRALRPITTLEHPIDPGDWVEMRDRAITPGSCVHESIGIIGHGRIGSRVARVAHALSMRVRCNDLREINPHESPGIECVDLKTLACESRVISIHIDGRASNARFFTDSFFTNLRSDAILINASRGFVLDSDAALRFARANPESRLILDVHDPEPIPTDSPLWTLPNVTLTPHIAAGTRQAKDAMSWVVRDVIRVLSGEPPEHPAP